MSLIVGLMAGIGLLLVYAGIGAREDRVPRRGWVDRLAESAGIGRVTAPRLLAGSAACGVLALFLVAGLTSSLVVASAFASMAASLPVAVLRHRGDRRLRRLREEWPDALATLIAAIRAGVSLPEACADLSRRSGEGLRPAFQAFTVAYRSSGSFAAGLAHLRRVAADPVADRVVVALGMAHDVGGTDLVRVLRTLGDFIRDDLRVRKEIEARWSWTVTSARVACAAPWVVLLLMSTRPEAAAAYNSEGGVITILIGGAATLVGYRAMLRASRLPEERRLG